MNSTTDSHFINTLEEVGLSETEANIYVSLLKTPKMTISEIARATNNKRTTCYQYLEQLLSKDFIVRVPVGKRMFYSAISPKKVLAAARKRYAVFETAVEEMTKQYDETTNKPQVIFYEGKREIKNIYEDLFKTIGDNYSIFPPAAFLESFTMDEYKEFDSLVGQYSFTSRDLIVSDKHFRQIEQIRKKNKADNQYTKKLPESFKSNVDVLIYGDKVALIGLRDLSALVIENKDISNLFRNIHSLIWKSL